MGLIARIIEAEGIPTVTYISLKEIAEKVRPPRTVHLRWPFGHPLGEANNEPQQAQVLHYGLKALYDVREPGTILEPKWAWRRQEYTMPENWEMAP